MRAKDFLFALIVTLIVLGFIADALFLWLALIVIFVTLAGVLIQEGRKK